MKSTRTLPGVIDVERKRLYRDGFAPLAEALDPLPGLRDAAQARFKKYPECAARVGYQHGPQAPGVRGRQGWVHLSSFRAEPMFATVSLVHHGDVTSAELDAAMKDGSLRYAKSGGYRGHRLISLDEFIRWLEARTRPDDVEVVELPEPIIPPTEVEQAEVEGRGYIDDNGRVRMGSGHDPFTGLTAEEEAIEESIERLSALLAETPAWESRQPIVAYRSEQTLVLRDPDGSESIWHR